MSKTATLKRQKIGCQDKLSLNAGQKYCSMLQREHSAILSTLIKLLFVIKTFVLSIFEWPFYTGLTLVLLVAAAEAYQPVQVLSLGLIHLHLHAYTVHAAVKLYGSVYRLDVDKNY